MSINFKSFLSFGCAALISSISTIGYPATQQISTCQNKKTGIVPESKISPKLPAISSQQQKLGERNPLIPPFCETFDNFRPGMEHEDFNRYFEVIDANNDQRTWGLYNYYEPGVATRCAYLLYPDPYPLADDWLITRAIKLKAGKYYCVNMDASLFAEGTPHSFEVKYGLFNDAEGLNTQVIDPVSVSTQKQQHVEGWISPEFDAIYYLGIHATSTTNEGYLFIDNIAIDAPKEGTAPAGIENLQLQNSSDGSTSVNISFTAPTKSINGSILNSITSLVIKRNNEIIKTFNDIKPGQSCSLYNTTPTEGEYIYTFTASNDSGEGMIVRKEHYVGLAAPVNPEITSFKDQQNGYALLEWNTPKEDINKNAIDPEIITYNIYDITEGKPQLIHQDIKGNSYAIKLPESNNNQSLISVSITATVNNKESKHSVSNSLIIGEPYNLPFSHSFTYDDYNKHIFEVIGDELIKWQMLDDASEPKSQDKDNGYISMIGYNPGESSELITGKINFKEADNPAISFYTYVYFEDENELKVSVIDMETLEKREVATAKLTDYTHVGWNRIMYSLKDFAGKTVRICIKGKIVTHGFIPIDNMKIYQLPDVDLSINNLEYPQYIGANEPFNIKATIKNIGSKNVNSFKATLICNEKEIDTMTFNGINCNETQEISFKQVFTATSKPTSTYILKIDAENEGNPSDNLSQPFTISFLAPNYPTPQNLSVEQQGNEILLQWKEPDMSKVAPEEIFDNFESYAPFSTSFGDWSLLDEDKGYVGGFKDVEIPGIDKTQQAFWIMPTDNQFAFLSSKSGKNVVAQMYSLNETFDNYVKCDDWLISPELYGGPQNISFWAVSSNIDYGYDTFEVYYSTTGTSKECFEKILDQTEASNIWNQYYISLPDGAKYFAIRCTSENIFMFMMDDFTFIPTGTPRQIQFEGYNIYRNNEKINQEPIKQTSFKTSMLSEYDTYFVTAVYDLGESIASNIVAINGSGIESSTIEETDGPVEIYNMQGIKCSPDNLTPGIYIFRRGNVISKRIIY